MTLSERPETAASVAADFQRLGFKILATEGTADFLAARGVAAKTVAKIGEARPDILDRIKNRDVHLIINTPSPLRDARADDASIRQAAIKHRIPYITTLAAAQAAVHGIAAAQTGGSGGVKSLQAYHEGIK